MPSPTAIINRLNTVLRRFTPFERTAYKRIITRTGDDLTGRAVATFVDTIFDPQPLYESVGREKLSGGHDTVTQVTANGKQITADDYVFTFSPTALVAADLTNPNFQLVLKDAAGNTEVFSVMDTSNVSFSGAEVVITVYARSIKRP